MKRILVVEKVADDFAELVLAKAKKLKAGDPMDPETDVGTVIHEGARLFEGRVNDASQRAPSCCTATTARARSIRRPWSTTCPTTASWCTRRRSAR